VTTAGAKLLGREAMQDKFRNVLKNAPNKVGAAMMAEMSIELLEVKKRTPKLSGALRESEHLIGPKFDGDSIIVLIVAGSADAPYAMIVHEDLEAFHKVGQAKYLESVLLESRSFIGLRVAKRLNIAEWVD
jgi:hypothetical protein